MENKDSKLEQLKKKHGTVYEFNIDGKTCFLKKPDRNTLGYAMKKGQSNPMAIAEVILESCWLDGDEEIKTDDDLFLGVASKIDALVEIKAAELKKH